MRVRREREGKREKENRSKKEQRHLTLQLPMTRSLRFDLSSPTSEDYPNPHPEVLQPSCYLIADYREVYRELQV